MEKINTNKQTHTHTHTPQGLLLSHRQMDGTGDYYDE
jgi:hypothetical protein